MNVEYQLELSKKDIEELDRKYPGGFATAQLPSLNLTVTISGTPEQVYQVKTILRRHYTLH